MTKQGRSRDVTTLVLDPANKDLRSPVAIALLRAAQVKTKKENPR